MNYFREKIGLIYFLIPYLTPVKNKLGLILSVFLGSSNYEVKLGDNKSIKFQSSKFSSMLNFLTILSLSTEYKIEIENVKVNFGNEDWFNLPINNLKYEDYNLMELLSGAIKFGANFVTDKNIEINKLRNKTFRISGQEDERKIVETYNGIKFYLDSIHPGNTIIETFVKEIHLINPNINWKDKIIIDVGAECGDTPLYFAQLGAKVFACEPIKEHFNSMVENLKLNPKLSEKIVPINAGIGKDEELIFYQDKSGQVGRTSFISNQHGKNAKQSKVKGYSLETLVKKFDINKIDLLKMDCKGCEYYLNEEILKIVKQVKIEYSLEFEKLYSLNELSELLTKSGFYLTMFNIDPSYHQSMSSGVTIYGTKNIIK
jgi:FkbM family methyltransferase